MDNNTLSVKEKIGYGMGDAGCNIIFGHPGYGDFRLPDPGLDCDPWRGAISSARKAVMPMKAH